MTSNSTISIHFIDNTLIAYHFPEQLSDADSIVSKVTEFFKHEYFAIESEGSLVFFLARNIKYIEVRPSSDITQGNVLRGAKLCELSPAF